MRAGDDPVGSIGRTWREEGGELTMRRKVRIRVSLSFDSSFVGAVTGWGGMGGVLTLRKMCEVWDEASKSKGVTEVVSCKSKQIPPILSVSQGLKDRGKTC